MTQEAKPAERKPLDVGIVAWAVEIRNHLAGQPGVEILKGDPGAVNFKFRGQEFQVYIRRTS